MLLTEYEDEGERRTNKGCGAGVFVVPAGQVVTIFPTGTLIALTTNPTALPTTPLKLGYKSSVAMQAIIRISAQNASGTVDVDTRLIENRVQMGN